MSLTTSLCVRGKTTNRILGVRDRGTVHSPFARGKGGGGGGGGEEGGEEESWASFEKENCTLNMTYL